MADGSNLVRRERPRHGAHLARTITAAGGTLPLLLWRRGRGRGGSLLTTAGGVVWQGLPPPSLLLERAPLPNPLPARSSRLRSKLRAGQARGEGVAGPRLVVRTSCAPGHVTRHSTLNIPL